MSQSKLLGKTLYSMITEDGRDSEKVADSFLQYLEKKHLLWLLPGIVFSLELEDIRMRRKKMLLIKTAKRLNENTLKEIKRYVKAPNNIEIGQREEPSLIGSFIAHWRGLVYDASVRRQLEKLKETLA